MFTAYLFKILQSANLSIVCQGFLDIPNATSIQGQMAWYPTYFYEIMKNDFIRSEAYRYVINSKAKNLIIVEVGTGDSLFLSLMCVRAGAKKIYAIEGNHHSYSSS